MSQNVSFLLEAVTNTVVANTSTYMYVSQRETVANGGMVSLVFLRGINEFHPESQIPLATKVAGMHRWLKGKSPISRPDVLRTNGQAH